MTHFMHIVSHNSDMSSLSNILVMTNIDLKNITQILLQAYKTNVNSFVNTIVWQDGKWPD